MRQDYREILHAELVQRQTRNAAYSSRAFARDLGVSPSFLSQVLGGHRRLTEDRALSMARALAWDETKTQLFALLVRIEQAASPEAKAALEAQLAAFEARHATTYTNIGIDTFRVVAEWFHMALVELTQVEGFRPEAAWIARRLGISYIEAELAVERLKRTGFLREVDGALVPASPQFATGDVPSQAGRNFHKAMLKLAADAVDKQDFAERDVSGVTVAIDPARLPEAKQMIRAFRRDVSALLGSGPKGKVYHLAVQLFRLDRDTPSPDTGTPAP